MEVGERTKLEIVFENRGARSENATVRRRYRKYWRTAQRLNYKSVTQRFERDKTFQEQMMAQGWHFDNISIIDEVAATEGEQGGRSKAQIAKAGKYVYRGKAFASEDEAWDKADLYNDDQLSQRRHWDRVKRRREVESFPQPSYPPPSWMLSQWTEDW